MKSFCLDAAVACLLLVFVLPWVLYNWTPGVIVLMPEGIGIDQEASAVATAQLAIALSGGAGSVAGLCAFLFGAAEYGDEMSCLRAAIRREKDVA